MIDTPTTSPAVARTVALDKVSWGAIFAGATVALIAQVLFTLLGAAVGIGTLDPGTADNPDAATFSIVAGLWYVLTGVISAYIGGHIAGRLSGKTDPMTGALHGLTTWAVTTLIVLYLLTSAVGSIVGGAFSGVSSVIGGASQTAAQAAGPALANSNPLDAISNQIDATGTDPEALKASAVNAMRAVVMGDPANVAQAREQAAQALSQARGIPLEQAQQDVARMEQEFVATTERVKQQATAAADATASVVSAGAFAAVFALILGAVASWFGGRAGVENLTSGRTLGVRRPV